MSITEKSGSFALDVISREQNNIKSQAALIELAKESIAKSEARIKQWSGDCKHTIEAEECGCGCGDFEPVRTRRGGIE